MPAVDSATTVAPPRRLVRTRAGRLDARVDAGALVAATGRLMRLVQARGPVGHVTDGLTVRVRDGVLTLATSDGETHAGVEIPATALRPGELTVARRVFGDVLAGFGSPASLHGLSLRVQHSHGDADEGAGRLVIGSPTARFALPVLDDTAAVAWPPAGDPAGEVPGAAFARVTRLVAGVSDNVPGVPALGGVRLRTRADRLVLDATDRFRFAHAAMPWSAASSAGIDLLIGGVALDRVARRVEPAETVTFEVSPEALTIGWPGTRVRLAALALPFPDVQLARLLVVAPETTVDVDAAALVAAVERAASRRGAARDVRLECADGRLVVRGADPAAGESEETVEATVVGPASVHRFNCEFLRAAVGAFGAAGRVRLVHQAGRKPTEITAVDGPDDARVLVLPMRVD